MLAYLIGRMALNVSVIFFISNAIADIVVASPSSIARLTEISLFVYGGGDRQYVRSSGVVEKGWDAGSGKGGRCRSTVGDTGVV